jgi:hypothetical protein
MDDPDVGRDYPLLERAIDLFLAPRRLFAQMRRRPEAWGAMVLSAGVTAAAHLVTLPISGLELPTWLLAVTLFLGVLASWGHLCVAALSGLAFGGFAGIDLPFRTWLALAAHCSLVSVLVAPLQAAAILWTGDPDLQLSLEDLLRPEAAPLARSFLSHVSLQAAAFLSLFGLGTAELTGASRGKAYGFTVGTWAGLRFMLAWFTAGS